MQRRERSGINLVPRGPFRHALEKSSLTKRIAASGNEIALGSKLVSFSKGFSKYPHILGIIKVDSEYSRLPFKLKVDYFILYWILVSTFVIFLPFFCYDQRKMQRRSREEFFHSNRMCIFKRKQKWKTDYQHVITSKKSSGHLLSVSALKVHFDIYLHFSLDDRFLVISLVTSR